MKPTQNLIEFNTILNTILAWQVAIAEGGSLMALEISTPRLLAPYYGSTLYVWSAVIGCTLGGLALGYLLGEKLAKQTKLPIILVGILVIAAVLCLLNVPIGEFILIKSVHLPTIPSLIVNCSILLLLPMTTFGMCSPLLIQILSRKQSQKGFWSGWVFGVSTLAGIIFTVLFAFWIIPKLGLQWAYICCGATLFFSAVLLYIDFNKST